MSISLWVCRVRFEPPFGPAPPGGWARHNAGARISGAQTVPVRLHRVRLTDISGDPQATQDSRKMTRKGGKRFRSEPPFAPTEGGVAINSCGAGSKASPEPSI